jgi:hypothetical protein
VRAAGYEIGNVDSTIVAQAPKMAPHIPAMRERIAALLGLPAGPGEREGQDGREDGPGGRGPAIETRAVCLLASAARQPQGRAYRRCALAAAGAPPARRRARWPAPGCRPCAASPSRRWPGPGRRRWPRCARRRRGRRAWSAACSFSGATPGPWSRTVTMDPGAGAHIAHRHLGHAGVGAAAVAARVLEQVQEDAAQLGLVGQHLPGRSPRAR